MTALMAQPRLQPEWSDNEIIRRVLSGDTPAYELLIRRYNQRIYRIVRAVLHDDAEAEDVMQEAYFRAYRNLAQFEGRSAFSTWLGRIAVHEALARLQTAKRTELRDFNVPEENAGMEVAGGAMNPEAECASQETRSLIERAILRLPRNYRVVLMMRDVDEMSTSETATILELSEDAVKVRLHRARALLRRELYDIAGATSAAAFQFHATRCDRVSQAVLARISQELGGY